MNIKNVDINLIKPAPYNPRIELKPGMPEYEKLKKSLEEFGYVDPIIYNKRTGYIVGGHQRYEVLKSMGVQNIDVVEVDIDDAHEKALNIALNKISGAWDPEKLEDLLRDINVNTDLNIEFTGFDLDEIETMFSGALDKINKTSETEEEDIEDDEDDFDVEDELKKAIENTKTKKGNLYKLGNHYLLCGDATSEEDINKVSQGKHINLVLTDPPYGINIVGSRGKVGNDRVIKKDENGNIETVSLGKVGGDGETRFGSIGRGTIVKANVYMPIKGDETTDTAKLNYELLKDKVDDMVIFGGNYFTDFLPPRMCWCVWFKHVTCNFSPVELAWTSRNTKCQYYDYMWAGLVREGDRKDELKKRVHPTQKPVGMLAMILGDFSKENDIVFDGFGGSGSTLIACEKMNRKCFMIEYEPYYCDVIVKRWEEYTGKKAELLE